MTSSVKFYADCGDDVEVVVIISNTTTGLEEINKHVLQQGETYVGYIPDNCAVLSYKQAKGELV